LYVLTNSGFLSSFYFYFFIFLILFFKHSYWDFQLDEIWHEKVCEIVFISGRHPHLTHNFCRIKLGLTQILRWYYSLSKIT
jgi:hypothetical protein